MLKQNGYDGRGDTSSLFVFIMVLLTFSIRRARTQSTLDLLESSVGARYFPVVVLYSWMQLF